MKDVYKMTVRFDLTDARERALAEVLWRFIRHLFALLLPVGQTPEVESAQTFIARNA